MLQGDNCERLREFLLYAQARTRGKQWTIWPEYSHPRGGEISTLEVVFDAQRALESVGRVPVVIVEYMVPDHAHGRCTLSHSEGSGFFWLGFLHVSAYCLTMADTLAAIDALVPYVPLVMAHRRGYWDWIDLKIHLRRCMLLESNDPVRVAALRRMLRED